MTVRLWLATVAYLVVSRGIGVAIGRRMRRQGKVASPTVIVGAGVVGEQIARRLQAHPEYGMRPIGFLDAEPSPTCLIRDGTVPVIGGHEDLEAVVSRTGARDVIVAFSWATDLVIADLVRRCDQLGLRVSLVPRLYEQVGVRTSVEHLGGLPLLTLRTIDPRGWQFALKYGIDRVVAALALVFLAPLMLLIALAIKLDSPGPVLYRQRRVGRDGEPFDVLKFRTMMSPAVEEAFLLPDGLAPGGVEGRDRRTRIGQRLRNASVDELPQLINVLRGEMSLIGPRPERPEYVERFVEDVRRYGDRLRVKSGITGWAQVHGLRGQTSIADRVEWDNYYIRNWSFRLDLRIVLLTVAEVLRFREGGWR
jgi:exopolysaccharide biosynthesis polyprenyl glycosylphosphotransferase